jgi:hypothetical protein
MGGPKECLWDRPPSKQCVQRLALGRVVVDGRHCGKWVFRTEVLGAAGRADAMGLGPLGVRLPVGVYVLVDVCSVTRLR